MAGRDWSEAVENALRRHVAKTGAPLFTRQALIESELDAIVAETGSAGATPYQTLSRELQQLRDAGAIEFVGQGVYRWLGPQSAVMRQGLSKGVFVVGSHSIYDDEPERFYRFPPRWMANAEKVVGNWIIYQEPRRAGPRGYYAVAKVERIVDDPAKAGMFLALIEPGSYLEFGRDVPFQLDGQAVERGLLNPDGRLNNGRAIQSIRPISDEDFNRRTETFDGLIARVIQHEYDHIEGILFTDRISSLKKRLIGRKLANIIEGKARPDYKMRFAAPKKGR